MTKGPIQWLGTKRPPLFCEYKYENFSFLDAGWECKLSETDTAWCEANLQGDYQIVNWKEYFGNDWEGEGYHYGVSFTSERDYILFKLFMGE
jgi:hypothetical protein